MLGLPQLRTVTSVCMLGLWASACTLGPTYRSPEPPIGAGTARFAAATPKVISDEPSTSWWRLFDDPARDELVREALAANTDLRVAEANLAEARAVLEEARAGRLPSTRVALGAGYGVSAPALTASAINRQNPQPQSIYQAGLDVSWELDLFGRVRRSIEAARADVGVAEAAGDGVRVVVAAETARAYADVCAYGEAAAVQRRSLATAERSLKLVEEERAAGAVGSYEVDRSEALRDQTQAAIPSLDAQRQAALYRLAVLTGRPPEAELTEAAHCVTAPSISRPLPVGDGRGLLRRRPDIRQAERRLAGETARVGVATADLYPTISLGGSLASLAPTPAALGAVSNGTWSIGSLLSWSFPNVAAARARVRQAEALKAGALAAFDGAVLSALQDVEQALATEAAELDRNAALRRARDRDAAALAAAEKRYEAGAISFLDRLEVERILISDEAALAASDRAVANDQVLVFKALGGGWEQPKVHVATNAGS